jgi:hypothetical protein
MIQQIPFVFRGQGLEISLRRLHVQEGDWPHLLQDLAFERARRDYVKAVDAALEENVQKNGRLTPGTILAVSNAVKVLSDKVQVIVSQKPEYQRFLKETNEFLERLKKAAEILDRKVVTDVIADLDCFSSTKLVDLLEFMRNYQLMFAEAKTPKERETYSTIFDLLKDMRNEYAKVRPDLF